MTDDTDNELNVQEQQDLFTVLSEDDECDKSEEDMDDEDQWDDIGKANVKLYLQHRILIQSGDLTTPPLFSKRGNSRSTYYRNKQMESDTKIKAGIN